MKISFVTTVYNEENTIEQLLFSLSQQTRKPDEIIIVDAGSTDSTLSVISNFQPALPAGRFPISKKNVKILIKKGNRAVGRNEGIKRANGDIIVVSDAGCLLHKDWTERITKPFADRSIDVVSGFYLPVARSVFEKCLATYTCVMPDRIDKKNFLPSSRSVAFRKSAWKHLAGYPEYLDTCEDLVFAKNLRRTGAKFAFVRNAIVYWPQRKNILQAFRQFFSYAVGDGQALYLRPQTPLLFARVLGGAILILGALGVFGSFDPQFNLLRLSVGILGVLYGLWAIQKNYHYIHCLKALFWLPVLQVVSDGAVFMGMSLGLLVRLKKML